MAFLRIEMAAVALGLLGSGVTGYGIGRTHVPPSPPPPLAVAPPAKPSEPDCSSLGVHLTVDGEDSFARASGERDLAGHKYRRGGDRSPWLTVSSGDIYVHATGGFLPNADVGKTDLTILTITVKGAPGGYELAPGGRSVFEVTGSDGKWIRGRFEADASHVADVGRPPPFGTPVVRARGTFCLPARPAAPNDTGP